MNVNVKPGSESGAALLAFMLILIVGTSYLLINKLNANLLTVYGEERTRIALYQAKQALIGYAVTYPDTHPGNGPGYLPCPDRNNDGSTDAGACSAAGNTTIGRFPYETLEMPELRDSYGERLWYILSDNFRNNPKLEPLNSETPGTLTVNGVSDIVAVIIAPGKVVGNQSRNPLETNIANEIQQYLEDDNNNFDTVFVTTAGTDFNDIVTIITREELMRAVEKRVLGEVKVFIDKYKTTYGAFPWLAPFADPKAEFRYLTGTHNGSDNSSNLTDTTPGLDFLNDWDVQIGDIVINITDGSIANVTNVTANTLSLDTLVLGTENDFDHDDEYVVVKTNWNLNILSGTASSGSSSLSLIDDDDDGAGPDVAKDFKKLGVSPGDIIDNVSTGLSSMVGEVVSSTTLTVKNNGLIFTPGNIYQIRSNIGQATGPDDSTNLVDTSKDFTVMGVQAGDLVVNLTDGSMTTVNSVAVNTLTLNTLHLGTEKDFDTNDYYYLPRYNTDNATREGLLSFHEAGKYFKTGYSIDWDFSAATASSTPAGLSVAYDTALKNYAKISAGNSGTITIDSNDGFCMWVVEDIADCAGFFSDIHLVKGTVTSGTNTSILTDSNADFTGDGIKEGDIVENYDDEVATGISGTATAGTISLTLEDTGKNFNALGIIPYYHIIFNNVTTDRGVITNIESNTVLTVTGYDNRPAISFSAGDSYTIYTPQDVVVTSVTSSTSLDTSRLSSTAPDFDYNAGGTGGYQEFYRIKVASKQLSGTEGGTSSGPTLDGGVTDFASAGVEAGDIVKNVTDGSYGKITGVTGTVLTAALYGGTDNQFDIGDDYEVYYDYVNTRQYEFRVRYSGTTNIYNSGDERKRDVCLGYNSDCSAITGTVTLPVHTVSAVTVRDLDINNVEVSNATVTIPASTSGSIKVSGLDYYLHVSDDEIPGWFVRNKWHQLVYVAYSADYVPGGTDDCITSVNCLTLNGYSGNDKHALAIIAGKETNTILDSSCNSVASAMQDRSTANMNAYFEMENCNPGDDIFQHASGSATYNDQDRIIQ